MNRSEDITKQISELGYRLTPQRLMILTAIQQSQDHISAVEIYAQVVARYPYVNISTVYRTLELLKELGLVTETDMGEGRVRYHPADKGNHHHLVCRYCGATVEFEGCDLPPFFARLSQETGYLIEDHLLELLGICAACQQQA